VNGFLATLKQYGADIRQYGADVKAAGGAFLSSQMFVALAALGVITFGSQAWTNPDRLPPIAPPPLSALGLAPALPVPPALLPEVQAQLDKAQAAADPYLKDAAGRALESVRFAQAVNYGGAAGSLILALLGLFIQNRQARRPSDAPQWWAAGP
jgi:hypothetical protein